MNMTGGVVYEYFYFLLNSCQNWLVLYIFEICYSICADFTVVFEANNHVFLLHSNNGGFKIERGWYQKRSTKILHQRHDVFENVLEI